MMYVFPPSFIPTNSSQFRSFWISKCEAKIRKKVYEYTISKKIYIDPENKDESFMDTDILRNKYSLTREEMSLILTTIQKELEDQGWTCTLLFGGSSLLVIEKGKEVPIMWGSFL